MKLNLGCANNKIEGYYNIDMDPIFDPDICLDITTPDWPIPTDIVDEVMAIHILEHLEGTQPYLTFWKELYRVCKNDAIIKIEVPHWEHENFYHDPTHVRRVTPIGIAMFDQKRNYEDWQAGGKETKLGMMCKVDFELQAVKYDFHPSTGQPTNCFYLVKCIKPARHVQ